jgi:proteasome accessory factor B
MNRGKTERLLNLVFALMGTAGPISRESIRRSVAGYESCSSDQAFERMFERDKDELRSMGVPIETVANAFDEVLGYRIAPDRYRLVDLDLSSRDLELLSAAAQVWDEAVLSNAAQTAMLKVESLHEDTYRDNNLAGTVRIRAQHANMLPLLTAARESKVVTFTYKTRENVVEKRTVEPWSVICRDGHWYLIGYDQVRGGQRTFRLSRIEGSISITAKKATVSPPNSRFPEVSLPVDETLVQAEVKVRRFSGALLRRHGTVVEHQPEFDAISLQATPSDLLRWLLPAAPELISVEPEALREQLVSRLLLIAGEQNG